MALSRDLTNLVMPFAAGGRTSLTSRRIGLASAALLLIPGVLLSLFVWDRGEFLINSDQLFTASLVWDLLHHADAWSSFQQPHSPSFVPEVLIHWIVQAATGSWHIALAAFVLVLILWLLAVMSWIVSRIAPANRETAILSLVLIASPLIFAAGLGPFSSTEGGAFFPWLFFVQPNSHGGTFLLALTAAAVASETVRRPSWWGPVMAGVLSFAGNASDQLFLVFFLVPVTAALLGTMMVRPGSRSDAVRLLAGIWAGAALGAASTIGVDRQFMPSPTPASMLEHAGRFVLDLGQHPIPLLPICCLAAALAAIAWQRRPREWLGDFWPVFAAGSAGGSLALTMALYEDGGSFRYAHPLLWWPVMFAAAALARRCQSLIPLLRAPYLGAIFLVTGLALSGPAAGWHTPRLLSWDSPLASCLRQAGLRAGLAEYWNARLTSAATNWDIQVEQINPDGSARIWGNDRLWFTHDIHDGTRKPPFQFIVVDGLPEERIAAAYGQPDRRMTCDGADRLDL